MTSVIIRGLKIFPLSGTFFRKMEKAQKFLEIFIYSMKKKIFLYDEYMINKNSKKKEKKFYKIS